jgi:serine/threonine-protein kinase
MAAERGPLRIVGRYALYSEIAAGGMATVHIGRLLGPVGFARTVAIKRLHPQFAKDPEFVSMFLDEARLAARVQHPNVVATIDVVATDGELFLIMDYVRGESLAKLLRAARKRGERIPPRIAASILAGFLHGLHSAHEAKNERGDRIDLVHRDVSPQNVLVGADGIPRVLDFGIAKAAGRIQVTRDGQIKGKLAYMPPEQLSGREVTRSVDIYAAAVVMWETLTGERLFKGETEAETLSKILCDPVIPPSELVPELPSAFDAPLLRALSREASKRQATARQLAFELEKCVGVASASEVGEWVEGLVGPTLSAREDQIAQIESHSVDLRVSPSGRPAPESSDTDSDLGVPRAARVPIETTMIGVGGASEPMPAIVDRRAPFRPDTPASALSEQTGSALTGSRVTGTLALPLDRRLPVVAVALALGVLLAIVGVVVYRRGAVETRSHPLVATATAALPGPSSGASALPGPDPSAQPLLYVQAEPPAATSAPPPAARPTATPPRPLPATSKPAPPAPAPRKNCDPPFSLDANGHKKYKLECM